MNSMEQVMSFLKTVNKNLSNACNEYENGSFKTAIDIYIDCYTQAKSITLQDEEVGNIGWFSREEISDLINNNKFLPPHIEFYDDCINYLDSKN